MEKREIKWRSISVLSKTNSNRNAIQNETFSRHLIKNIELKKSEVRSEQSSKWDIKSQCQHAWDKQRQVTKSLLLLLLSYFVAQYVLMIVV